MVRGRRLGVDGLRKAYARGSVRTSVLERIALHQPRLNTPGLGLDSKGVALGAKGLVVLPSMDRLVALLAVYTREHSLEDLLPSLSLCIIRSAIGVREIVVEFAAESTERMDALAETARMVGGFTFTGTTRHFVQYRDAAAPFGYDAVELSGSNAALALYHDRFSQTYDIERLTDLRSLLLRLMLRPDASHPPEAGARILVAEPGLGPALVHYLVRSNVRADVCVAEWPPESALDDAPIRRWLVRVPDPPERMRALLLSNATPGIACFVPTGPGVAVEAGFRHPIELKACPLFDPAGLVLLRGRGDDPWVIDRLPAMGDILALARFELRADIRDVRATPATAAPDPDALRVPVRIVASTRPWRSVTATWIAPDQTHLLRWLVYALPRSTIERMQVAFTVDGTMVRSAAGVEGLPLGTFLTEVHPRLYVPAGYEMLPDLAPDVLARALDLPESRVLVLRAESGAVTVDQSAFVPLDVAIAQAPDWVPLAALALDRVLEAATLDLRVEPIGLTPLWEVDRRS